MNSTEIKFRQQTHKTFEAEQKAVAVTKKADEQMAKAAQKSRLDTLVQKKLERALGDAKQRLDDQEERFRQVVEEAPGPGGGGAVVVVVVVVVGPEAPEQPRHEEAPQEAATHAFF